MGWLGGIGWLVGVSRGCFTDVKKCLHAESFHLNQVFVLIEMLHHKAKNDSTRKSINRFHGEK